jgi:hypothetical protein
MDKIMRKANDTSKLGPEQFQGNALALLQTVYRDPSLSLSSDARQAAGKRVR